MILNNTIGFNETLNIPPSGADRQFLAQGVKLLGTRVFLFTQIQIFHLMF